MYIIFNNNFQQYYGLLYFDVCVCVCVYSWSQTFTHTLQNLQNVDYFTK